MYYIYHIKGVKIGCSKNPKRRVAAQGYKDYEILEVHNDIDVADKREIELQKQYNYPNDKSTYKETLIFGNKAYTKRKRPVKKEFIAETIEEKSIRLKKWHEDMKSRGVGCYDKTNCLNAGLVSKELFSKPILAYRYPSMESLGEFTSAKHFAREYNIKNIGNIRNILKGRSKSSYGYTFRYA